MPQRSLGPSLPAVRRAFRKANAAKTAEAKTAAKRKLSPYPRSPKHGKHSFVQGDPNTKEHNR